MTNVVLVGGNGYIGREITKQWLRRDPKAEFWVTSRSDRQEVQDPRVHHVKVDVNDSKAFDAELPAHVDYIVNLTYGSPQAIANIRDFAATHGVKAIGNINAVATTPGFEDFVSMKNHELADLRKGDVPVANYDLTVAYGEGRDDDLMKAVRSGALDDQNPVNVDVVARLLIDRMVRDWTK